MKETTQCGYVAIIGRPNVGKSTLLNKILKQKLCITSRKPQTTRHQILGLKTEANVQAIYVDTPGIHGNMKKALNRYMNRAASSVIHDVDVILYVSDGAFTEKEHLILQQLDSVNSPVILVLNKVDQVKPKAKLLNVIAQWQQQYHFTDIIPISAKLGDQVNRLEQLVAGYLPESPFFFAEDQITDRSERFIAAEIIREKLMRSLGEELPYALTVAIDLFKDHAKPEPMEIAATIFIERPSQKAIIIGKGGQKLKEVGKEARLAMNDYFARRVHLQLWVKVKSGWSDSDQALRSLGYSE